MSASIARNIILVGLMGTGKSSLAQVLARKTGCPVFDTDLEIEKNEGMSPTQIFAEKGEDWFRDLETDYLKNSLALNGCIFSTGGGMVIRPQNRQMLRELGFVVWLNAPAEVIYNRVARSSHRPLLKTADPRATLQELIALREPWYREVADCQIDTAGTPRNLAVKTVLQEAGWPWQSI